MWVEIPLSDTKNPNKTFGEVIIVQKSGYYLEQIQRNMPHLEKLLKVRYPQLPCQMTMKQSSYPLQFLSDNQEIIDAIFQDQRLYQFFIPSFLTDEY